MHTDGKLYEAAEDPIKQDTVFIRTQAVLRRSKYHRCVQCPVSDVGVCSAVRHAAGMQSIRLAGVWPAQAAEQQLIKMIGH